MARIPSHGQSLFPGWLRPSSAGSAIIRAEDVDWQSLLSDAQGQADLRAFLSAQLGVYVQRIGGLTYANDLLHLSYNDETGAAQSVSVDITSLAQGVVPIVGHTDGWQPTRLPLSDFGVEGLAIGMYRASSDLIQVADENGIINGTEFQPPGASGVWRNYAANETAHFWSRRGANQHVNFYQKVGGASGEHRHETENGEIYSIAADADNIWLLLYDSAHSALRLMTYTIDATGAQDPNPNQTIDHTTITHDLPAGSTAPDDVGGVVHHGDRVYVLVRGTNDDGLPVTHGLAYTTTHPFARRSADDRFYGVSSDVVGGYFTDDTDWVLQSHWLVKYLATTMLGHNDTPSAFGAAGYALVVNSARTAVEFSRLSAAALGTPMVLLAGDIELSHDSLSALSGVDFTNYAFVVVVVHDVYGRYSAPLLASYARLNALPSLPSATALAGAGNSVVKATGWLGAHNVEFGIVRTGDTSLSLGQLHEAQEPFTPNLIATSVNSGNIEDWDSIILSFQPQAVFTWPSAPAGGQFGMVFGDENYALTWFFAADLFSKERITSQTTTPTDANSILLAGALGERSIRLARRSQGPIVDAAEVWVTHSGHSPWPIRVYRSWTSGITDLTVSADVYGFGRR